MSEPIGPGDWIEAIRSESGFGGTVIIGVPYQVERLVPALLTGTCETCGDDGDGLSLVGITLVIGASWCRCGFRPIGGRPAALDLTRLMDVPAREGVDA